MDIVSIFYAALGYLALVAATLGAMLFTGDGSGMAMMDTAAAESPSHAVFVDCALLVILALLHGVLSQKMLKEPTNRMVPKGLERATHAWLASAVVLIVYCAWRPIPQVLWSVSGTPAVLLSVSFYAGWTLALVGVFLTYHLDLFQLGQAQERVETQRDGSRTSLRRNRFLAAWLSHPCYAGILVGLWSTSLMTAGHLLLAAVSTGYLLFDALRATARAAAHKLDESAYGRGAPPFRAPRFGAAVTQDSGDHPIIAKPAHHA